MGKKQDDSFSNKWEIHLSNYFTVMNITDVDKTDFEQNSRGYINFTIDDLRNIYFIRVL